jgi:acetate kinase
MIDTFLVLNTGSSSLKFQVFRRDGLDVLLAGKVTGIGERTLISARLTGRDEKLEAHVDGNDHDAALKAVIDLLDRNDNDWTIAAIAHRIVHGGAHFVEPVIVTPDIVKQLEALIPLAPLHQPHNLAGIAASERLATHAPNIACFDTAFHAGQAELFHSFAIDRKYRDQGIRRYGFHGISYEWIARVLKEEHPDLYNGRVVIGHLGNGASLCALQNGRSVDTTMSMTALDGIAMGTRSGAIDPGAVIYMLRELGLGIDEVEHVLYEKSGLKGLSGMTNDVETLLASHDPQARFALDYFALRTAQYAAMMAVSMGGMDALVFTGGIGEHAAAVREGIVGRLGFLGNFRTLVIPANEERMMAVHAKRLLGDGVS